jgi:hypothetical protein
MVRPLITALLCGLAIVAGDLFFRSSLLSRVRPIILTPREQAVMDAPVEVRWDGPEEMRVILTPVGDAPRELGVKTSPFEIGRSELLRDGGYKVELQALRFGDWIRTERLFQVYAAPPPKPDEQDDGDVVENRFLLSALDAVRRVRDQARGRAKQYRLENSVLRDETARLSEQIEALQRLQDDDLVHAEDLETRFLQLAGQFRALSEENLALRMRLETVIPCTVWGYYSYPRPNTIPATRQIVAVTDSQARIFRNQLECEAVRRDDPTASSTCFCVGNSWGR